MLTLSSGQTLQGSAATAAAITYTITGSSVTSGISTYTTMAQGQLPSVAGTILSVTSSSVLISHILLSNTSAIPISISIYVDGSASSNLVVTLNLPANGSATFNRDG